MRHLVGALFDIALHRRGPEELPASQFLLVLLLGLYLIVGLISLQALGLLSATDTLVLFVDSAFYLACVFAALRLFKHEGRFLQTANALLGTDVLLSLIGLPLAYWGRSAGVPADELTVPMALRLLILLWWIDVAGFILSRALARPYIVGVLFVILYLIVSLNVRELIAPAAT